MSRMFEAANDFNQDLGNWNVANVVDMTLMFQNANSFDQEWAIGTLQV